MNNFTKVLITIFLVLGVMYVSSLVNEDCARRICPGGTKPRIVRYEGCVCLGKAR